MIVKIFDDERQASHAAYKIVRQAHENGAKVFGWATGATPELLYEELVNSDIDFSDSISVNLDEYFGLDEQHDQSYHAYMEEHLFDEKPFKASYLPHGDNMDVDDEIARYNQILEDNPVDLQILGIGRNGHIGFNEPGSNFNTRTQLVDLTETTIEDNQRFFEDKSEVPTKAYSMGIQSIMEAKAILLLAFGKGKAEAVKAMIEGPVTENLPASILQKHPRVMIILDKAAASLLQTKSTEPEANRA